VKVWIAALVLWYALLAAGFLVVRDVDRKTAPTPDYDRAAVCLWDRWDTIQYQTFEQTARIIRFCLEVEPHSLPPSLPSETR